MNCLLRRGSRGPGLSAFMWTYLQSDHQHWIDPAGCHRLLCAGLENSPAHHRPAYVLSFNPTLVLSHQFQRRIDLTDVIEDSEVGNN